jgi:taurine dioxygenase
MTATARQIDARELTTRNLPPGFPVEILDLDIANADEADLLGFDTVCRSHPVVVIRNQTLTPPQLLALAGRLGRVSPQHRTGPHPDYPGISILSNKKVNGRLIGVPDAGRNWHTDGTTYTKLGLQTILYGLECPPEGADTCFTDMVAAFESLPEARQKQVEQLQVVHNRAHLIQKYNRAVLTADDLARMQDILHPMVIASPLDGRKSLFLTKGSTKSVVGMPEAEGLALVDELIAYATSQERFVYRHKWQVNDVVIWNNLCTLHQATPFDEDKYERLVHRVWIRPRDTVEN